jgi:hypothetical protein
MKRFLALSAMLFLLLRPLCDVQAAGAAHDGPGAHTHAAADFHGHEPEPCCAEFEDRSLVGLSATAVAPGFGYGQPGLTAPVLVAAHDAVASAGVTRRPPGFLPTSLSFYARSARIRR